MQHHELFALAERTRENAYAPYSHYTVGAALLCASGKVYTGVNIENASFGATNCAERTALFSAVAAGERDFVAIAVAGGRQGEASGDCTPCGICRQVLAEFADPDLAVILKDGTHTLGELLPLSFTESKL
ncbi:MAG: cytidine deaminase [Clostridia bacterium]|nr:cytidine deaminase [Clostridia bacterium]